MNKYKDLLFYVIQSRNNFKLFVKYLQNIYWYQHNNYSFSWIKKQLIKSNNVFEKYLATDCEKVTFFESMKIDEKYCILK